MVTARRPRRHDARRHRRPRLGRLQCRRPRYHHRPHLPHARGTAQGDSTLPHPHQEPLRCQHHPSSRHGAPELRRIRPGYHRRGDQGRRDCRKLSRACYLAVEEGRHHCSPQVHHDSPCSERRQAWRRLPQY
ncbi:hypothetical protein LB505_006332 [Fusarium chuoi]|nr:hypothetical protein LB505_006332 [Fusarium chuoi]